MEKYMVIMMGIQGGGKTTFFNRFLADKYVHINLDTLKTRHKEKLLIEECFNMGKNFAIDNTNPTKDDRARYIALAKEKGYRVVGYFMESKLQKCIARNELREGGARIPAKAIASTSNKLELPSYDEGFDELYFVANDGEKMTFSKWREDDEF